MLAYKAGTKFILTRDANANLFNKQFVQYPVSLESGSVFVYLGEKSPNPDTVTLSTDLYPGKYLYIELARIHEFFKCTTIKPKLTIKELLRDE